PLTFTVVCGSRYRYSQRLPGPRNPHLGGWYWVHSLGGGCADQSERIREEGIQRLTIRQGGGVLRVVLHHLQRGGCPEGGECPTRLGIALPRALDGEDVAGGGDDERGPRRARDQQGRMIETAGDPTGEMLLGIL